MTRDKEKFVDIVLKTSEFVTYGNNNKGRILRSGDSGNGSSILVQNALFIEDLKHTLLSISQPYDKGHNLYIKSLICL